MTIFQVETAVPYYSKLDSVSMTSAAGFVGEYEGELVDGRMEGLGTYTSSMGKYQGQFLNGLFDGEGALYMHGGRFQGTWKKGNLIEGRFIFDDGLKYKSINDPDEWKYLNIKDPRFLTEIKLGLKKGEELQIETANNLAHLIPPLMYDTTNGYYDPETQGVYSLVTQNVIHMPDAAERDWLVPEPPPKPINSAQNEDNADSVTANEEDEKEEKEDNVNAEEETA